MKYWQFLFSCAFSMLSEEALRREDDSQPIGNTISQVQGVDSQLNIVEAFADDKE